jgi:hypothetical protein
MARRSAAPRTGDVGLDQALAQDLGDRVAMPGAECSELRRRALWRLGVIAPHRGEEAGERQLGVLEHEQVGGGHQHVRRLLARTGLRRKVEQLLVAGHGA